MADAGADDAGNVEGTESARGPQVRGRRPEHGEPVLDRAFRILSCFGPATASLPLTSLAARASLPKATASRLAHKLVELGALERAESGDYVIGLRLLEVASLAPRGHGLRETALPFMEDLHHATGQHVLLAVRDGHEAVLVERLSARGAGRVMYRVGGRMPLHSTGVGLALLAHAPADVQEEIAAGDLVQLPESIRISAHDLRTRLAGVRRDGVAIVSRPQPEPMTSVAAAIVDRHRAVVGAISVVTRSAKIEAAILTPAVIAVARSISRGVSGPGGLVAQ
ncbi:MAG TPA: IclR family transcriptional regulator [Actinocrinis sp.]|nr:IclR family transcriptional regulator [Actinocrinis sp.]